MIHALTKKAAAQSMRAALMAERHQLLPFADEREARRIIDDAVRPAQIADALVYVSYETGITSQWSMDVHALEFTAHHATWDRIGEALTSAGMYLEDVNAGCAYAWPTMTVDQLSDAMGDASRA